MKKILVCVGTRPEAIKMAPIITLLKKENIFETIVCSTGQHKEMIDEIFSLFKIIPDVDFKLMHKSSGILDLKSKIMQSMDVYLDVLRPDLILAQGDTVTVSAAAIAAYYKQIMFGHVEAGLRTFDKYSPWPEEGNRKIVSAIADLHFAPTNLSKINLLNEGVSEKNIYVTGNPVIDALKNALELLPTEVPSAFLGLGLEKYNRIILITGHRRENIGEGFQNIFGAIGELASLYPEIGFVFPVHLNPSVRKQVEENLGWRSLQNLHLINPLSYSDFVWIMNKSYFILSDSGGVQEEAPSLGKPVLVTRNTTERPEGVAAGVVKLVGTERKKILDESISLLESDMEYRKMAQSKNPYGNGTSAEAIINIIKKI